MKLTGEIDSISGRRIKATIVTHKDETGAITIGDEQVRFVSDSPITIKGEFNDSFDHILPRSAAIVLHTRQWLEGLYCTDCRDAVVTIERDGQTIFSGYLMPQTYSQEYNSVWDELTLNCIDRLSALQFAKYRDIGMAGKDYAAIKGGARQRSFKQLLTAILGEGRIWYDCSKAISSVEENKSKIFEGLSISELLFLGDTEDDTWTQREVIEEMMRYLNLHITQIGDAFYIFSWETIVGGGDIEWTDIATGDTQATGRSVLTLTNDNASDTDASLTIGEVFNKLELTCSTKSVESIVESPLSESSLTPAFTARQLYMTEYSADGEGERAFNALKAMCTGLNTDYEGAVITDHYIQLKGNKQWKFYGPGSLDLYGKYASADSHQEAMLNDLSWGLSEEATKNSQGAFIVSLGKIEKKQDKKDNSPTGKLTMDNYLVLTVNGNDYFGQDMSGNWVNPMPNDQMLLASCPRATYEGSASGGVLSPSDPSVTNYIVISGSLMLNPLLHRKHYCKNPGDYDDGNTKNLTIPSADNEDGRHYAQRFYECITPLTPPSDNDRLNSNLWAGFQPVRAKIPEELEFKYSAIGEGTDQVSKVGIVACMLIVGDKCVVETGTQGRPEDFVWQQYKTLEECNGDLDEYYAQSFTIGFNPAIGDKLIGHEFDIQNNIDYQMNLDCEGTAIPIKFTDKIAGQVKFMILGPVNAVWSDYTRRHKTWFRHTGWGVNSIPLLAKCANILIKEFEVKVYSDNGKLLADGESDLIYISDTQERFVNKKEIAFRLTSALTAEECVKLDVAGGVQLSTPLDANTQVGCTEIYDLVNTRHAKAEQLYVDSYYTEYSVPRPVITQRMKDKDGNVSPWRLYRHPAMGRTFYPQSISYDLQQDEAQLTLKDKWYDKDQDNQEA